MENEMSETNNKKKLTESIKDVTQKISEKASSVSDDIGSYITQKKLEKLMPIFEDDLIPENFRHERIIRVVNYDAKRDQDLCKGSVGFYEKTPERKIPTIYTKDVGKIGLSFFPHLSESIFVADPCIEGNYIEIDEYFNYMKQVRVNELTLIAQSLGAKHVDIKLRTKTNKSSFVKIGGKAGTGFKKMSAEGDINQENESKSKETFEIWASTDFKTSFWNGNPVLPPVLYFKNESDIQSLIQMVLINKSKLTKRTYSMRASSSSGVSMTEASNIGASLKSIKVKAGASFEKRAKEESEAILEYTIDF